MNTIILYHFSLAFFSSLSNIKTVQIVFVSSYVKNTCRLEFRCRFSIDSGHNLNFREKHDKLVGKNDIIFLQVEYLRKTVRPVVKN